MIYRVLTADYHARAGDAQRLILGDTELPLRFVGHARSADELLALAKAESPDIVIVEPHLRPGDGFEALAQVHALRPGTHTVIVSTSERFEDAVRAMEIGAVAYIRKPVDPMRLQDAVRAIVEVAEGQSVDNQGEIEFHYEATHGVEGLRVCAFRVGDRRDCRPNMRLQPTMRRLTVAGLKVVACDARYVAVLLPSGQQAEHVDFIVSICRELLSVVQVGVGLPTDTSRPAWAMTTALEALDASYFVDGDAVIYFEQVVSEPREYPLALEEEMRQCVIAGDLSTAQAHLERITAVVSECGGKSEVARERYRDLLTILSRAFAARLGVSEASLTWLDEWSRRLEDTNTAFQALRVIDAAWEDARTQVASEPRSAIKRAQAYIHAHSQERLRVADVAAAAGFHPDYLSHMFRRELGTTVGAFLTECRIERAKGLLRSSADPITTVALNVGFADHRYFGQLFRRATGMTPRDYRLRYRSC